MACFALQFGRAGVHGFTQGFARFEVGNTLLGNGHTLAAARVATHTRRTVVDGKTTEPSNLDAVPAHQCFTHGVKNGLDSSFGITVCKLAESRSQLFHKVRSCHIRYTPRLRFALANPLAGGSTSGLAKPVPRCPLEESVRASCEGHKGAE